MDMILVSITATPPSRLDNTQRGTMSERRSKTSTVGHLPTQPHEAFEGGLRLFTSLSNHLLRYSGKMGAARTSLPQYHTAGIPVECRYNSAYCRFNAGEIACHHRNPLSYCSNSIVTKPSIAGVLYSAGIIGWHIPELYIEKIHYLY